MILCIRPLVYNKCSQMHAFFLEGNAIFGKMNFRRSGKLLGFLYLSLQVDLLHILR